MSKEEFKEWIKNDELYEYSLVYEDYKGVPRKQIREGLRLGHDCVLRLYLSFFKSNQNCLFCQSGCQGSGNNEELATGLYFSFPSKTIVLFLKSYSFSLGTMFSAGTGRKIAFKTDRIYGIDSILFIVLMFLLFEGTADISN